MVLGGGRRRLIRIGGHVGVDFHAWGRERRQSLRLGKGILGNGYGILAVEESN